MMEAIQKPNEHIFDILFHQNEITWQSMIYDLVSSERMDPWDVDVSLLAQRFLERLQTLKNMDLKVSGKILLAASILLRVKSTRFLEEDINALDALIASANNEQEEEYFEELLDFEEPTFDVEEQPKIYPKTPQPRKRKVSVFDLVNALEKALDVFKRRPAKPKPVEETDVRPPEKPRDISLVIRDMHNKVVRHYENSEQRLKFSHLLEDDSREEKVFTFIPLLHLDHQRKVELCQEQNFGDIEIEMLSNA